MTRLLNILFIFASTLLLSIPLYANLPADSLLDKYVKGLHTAIEQKVEANKTAAHKDYLLVYEDPSDPKFRTDFVNNGRDFWFTEGSDDETALRNLVNDAQGQTGGEPLYVVLGSIYNYADLEDVNQTITWIPKDKYKPADQDHKNADVRLNILPAVAKKKDLTATPHSVLYVISYFTIDREGYKVSHRCFFESAFSLKQNGFVVSATDRVETTNKTETDLKDKRVSFLKSTITAVAKSMAQFSEELKKVNALFALLPENSLGKQFYNAYNGVCKDQLVLKKLALLINEMGYDTYAAYLNGKRKADGYDAVIFRDFYDALNKFYESYKKIIKQLPEIKTPGELVKLLDDLSATEMAALSYDQRIRAIRLLNSLRELTDGSLWQIVNVSRWVNFVKSSTKKTVVGSEDILVALVASTPATQQAALVAELKGTDGKYQLLRQLFKKTDDAPLGEDNYSTLVQYLASFVVASATDQMLDDMYSNNRIFTWSDDTLRNVIDIQAALVTQPNPLPPNTYITLGNENVDFQSYYVTCYYKPGYGDNLNVALYQYKSIRIAIRNADGSYTMGESRRRSSPGVAMPSDKKDLNPFDLVAIIPVTAIDFKTGFALNKDQVNVVPAFVLEWYLKKDRNKDIKTGVNLTLAAVTAVTGVGAIVNAAGLTARIIAAAQTVFALTAIAGEEYEGFNVFMKDHLGTFGYGLFKGTEFCVNLYSGAKGLVGLGKGAYTVAKNMSKAFADLLRSRPDVLARLQLMFPDRCQKLMTWLSSAEAGGADLPGIAARGDGLSEEWRLLTKNKIALDVKASNGADQISYSKGVFKESAGWRDPNYSLLETAVPRGTGGGVGTATALVSKTQTAAATLEYTETVSQQLARLAMHEVGGTQVSVAQATEIVAATATQLRNAQLQVQLGTLKVLSNTSGSAKMVLLAVAGRQIVLFAQGEAQPVIQSFAQTQPQPQGQGQQPLPGTQTGTDNNKCNLCEAEPMICALAAKARYDKKNDALIKICDALAGQPQQRAAVCLKLGGLSVARLDLFLEDVLNNKPSTRCDDNYNFLAQHIAGLTPGLISSWENYVSGNRRCVRVSVDHLRKMDNAWNNPQVVSAPYAFKKADFVGIARAGRTAGTFAEKYDATVFDNLQLFCRLQAHISNLEKLKAKLQQEKSGPELEGVNFIIKYIGTHTSEFNGKTLNFEDGDISSDRDIDLTVASIPMEKIYYEFKSVENLSEGRDATADKKARLGFVDQLTKDLRNARFDEQILWIFDATKILTDEDLRDKVTTRMKSDRGKRVLNSLSNEKKEHWFGRSRNQVGDLTDAEIDWFISHYFSMIFRRG
jgi:hypothetical protein